MKFNFVILILNLINCSNVWTVYENLRKDWKENLNLILQQLNHT